MDIIDQHEQDKKYCQWFDKVSTIAAGAGVAIAAGYEQTFELLYFYKETPGNAVKRYVDTRVRMYCIQNNCL